MEKLRVVHYANSKATPICGMGKEHPTSISEERVTCPACFKIILANERAAKSWEGHVDRMSGAYDEWEIRRAGEWESMGG